jgi:hypothetical protein
MTEDHAMMEVLSGFSGNAVGVQAKGQITRNDYENVLVPEVESAIKRHGKVRLYYQIGPEFTGIDPGAAFQDLKVGMEHFSQWERVAVVTDVDWIRHSVRAFGFLMPIKMETFSIAEAEKAREWISAA